MKVLVDYANVQTNIQARGLIYLADRIAGTIDELIDPAPATIDIRLYSGWDRGYALTNEAQRLAAEIGASFPRILQKKTPMKLNVELAHTLEIAPRKRLVNKLRLEPVRASVRFKKPSATTCRNATCPIDNLYDFFSSGGCPIFGCYGTVDNLADQEQQKLVDTMLVADMIYLASNSQSPICLVSSDDDMWPGIISALAANGHVIHLQTKQWSGTSPYMIPNLGTYEQRVL